MSWDADLLCACCRSAVDDWNYTHNTNGMVHEALSSVGHEYSDRTWFAHLSGLDGPTGSQFLDLILAIFASDPDRYRAMNPENGWGDFDSLVAVLTEMSAAGLRETPTIWECYG